MFNIDERSSTLPRMGHTIVADEITQSLIIYGGYSFSYGVLGDTWIYDITNRSYVRAQYGSEAAPSPRYLHAGAVYYTLILMHIMVHPRKYSAIFLLTNAFCYLRDYITCTKIRNRPINRNV